MHELIPVVFGVVIGLAVQEVRGLRLRTMGLVVLCLVGGTVASWINGELEVSYAFVSVDALLVWFGALAALSLATVWRRRSVH